MPWGKHIGRQMQSLPAHYLVWLYDKGCKNQSVLDYITPRIQALRDQSCLDAARSRMLGGDSLKFNYHKRYGKR